MIVSPFKLPVSTQRPTQDPCPRSPLVNPLSEGRMAIAATGVEMSYLAGQKRIQILKQVDLTIERGQVQLLMGPSGSGENNPSVDSSWTVGADGGVGVSAGRGYYSYVSATLVSVSFKPLGLYLSRL